MNNSTFWSINAHIPSVMYHIYIIADEPGCLIIPRNKIAFHLLFCGIKCSCFVYVEASFLSSGKSVRKVQCVYIYIYSLRKKHIPQQFPCARPAGCWLHRCRSIGGTEVMQVHRQPNHLTRHTDIWTACQLQLLIWYFPAPGAWHSMLPRASIIKLPEHK